MKRFLTHYFLPHESNNYRSKLLHHKILFLLIAILFIGGFVLSAIRVNYPSVLGISSNISIQELLVLTNQERQVNGLHPLQLSNELSVAADSKAANMLAENYWAHQSPSGLTPWVFIKNAGYNYVYAGENLARGFTNTAEVTSAWMASPTHRQNVLSSSYRDVGFAIRTGVLGGEETVIVVEMLGSRDLAQVAPAAKPEIAVAFAENETTTTTIITTTTTTTTKPVVDPQSLGVESNQEANTQSILGNKPLVNSLKLSSNVVRIIVGLFIITLILDMIIVEKRKIIRFVGHNIDHILFLTMLLILIGFLTKGIIA